MLEIEQKQLEINELIYYIYISDYINKIIKLSIDIKDDT